MEKNVIKEKVKNEIQPILKRTLLQDFYSALHDAYNSMLDAFRKREEQPGFSQDRLATLLNVDKALISRRLKGMENLTLRSLSSMATALDCRLVVKFQPFEEIDKPNYPGQARLNNQTMSTSTSAGKMIMKAC